MISEFNNVPDLTKARLSKVVLGNAPRKGEKRVFSSSAIAMAFRKHLSKDQLNQVKIVIPNEVLVRIRTKNFDEKQIEKELKNKWSAFCKECNLKIQMLSLPVISNTDQIEEWNVEVGKELSKGNFTIPIYIKKINENFQQYWLSGHLRVYKKVPVVQKAMAYHERFTEENVILEEKDITFSYDSTPQLADIYGKQSSQTMSTGSIVWQRNIYREKALKRGEIVKLVIGNEVFELSTLGQAEQDAFIGDTVNVKNLKTNKIVSGEVINKGEVKIE